MPTIGVSVAVPEPWGSELQQYRIASGDESARHIPTHITLLPPHEVAADDLEGVVAHLGTVASACSPFRAHLRGPDRLDGPALRALQIPPDLTARSAGWRSENRATHCAATGDRSGERCHLWSGPHPLFSSSIVEAPEPANHGGSTR